MIFKIFISSVQREFAEERKLLAEYIRKDAILGKFFGVFVFEEVPAQERSAADVYLSEVDACDIYLGILGAEYGAVDRKGVSATEREYERAERKQKERICFIRSGIEREPKESAFVARVNVERTRKSFATWDDLRVAVYAALANFLEAKGLISVLPFDSSKAAGVQLKDLSAAKMREFIREAREIRGFNLSAKASPLELLTALELVDDAGRIVNSAALLFGKRPQRFFRNSEVKCAWFLTPEVSKPIEDYQIYEGDVFQLADQATAFVMSHLSRRIGEHDGETGAAPTKYELPRKAVFEAIVNAVCHRDYESNAAVQVMLFRDRLEIMNPGTLPPGWTAATLLTTHESIPRNKVIAKALDWAGYVERSGHGTEFIIEKCEAQGLSTPQYKPDSALFHTIIWRKTEVGGVMGGVVAQSGTSQGQVKGTSLTPPKGGVGAQSGPSQGLVGAQSFLERIVSTLFVLKEAATAEVANAMNLDSSSGYLKRKIKLLLSDGIIEYTIPEKPRSRLQKYRLTQKGRQMLAQKGR